MNCEKVKAKLSAYIDGEVSEKDAAAIRRHIAICSDCGQEEQLLRRTSGFLGNWENVRAPDGFCEALLAKAEIVPRRPRRNIVYAVRPLAGPRALIRAAICGATVLLLCIGLIFFAMSPLRKAPMVEPLPTSVESTSQKTDNAAYTHQNSPRYTTMAEVKVAGIWK